MKERIMKKLVLMAAVAAVLAACNSGMGENSGNAASGKKESVDRSQRTVIDAAKYTDFTVKENNAAKITKQDILFTLNDTYSLGEGNSYITIDRKEGTITLSSDDAWYNGGGGHNMYAKYAFDVQAANENCLYVRMDGRKGALLIIDSESFTDNAVPDLFVCLPLYGFSRNRIEVSPVMDGYILMPSGTYWARKK
jgi:predicted small secreted protein